MKIKKILAAVLAGAMVLGSAISVSAATADVDITGGLGSGNTGDEAVTGNFDVTYTFKNASHDTSLNWNNFAVEVFGEGFGITARADAYAVGYNGAENVLGGWGDKPIAATTKWTGQPANDEEWAAWAKGMADASCNVNVKRSGNVLTITYKINAGGKDYTFVGTTPEVSGMPDALSVHITGEKTKISNVTFKNNASSAPAADSQAAPSGSQAAPADTGTIDKALTTATNAAFGTQVNASVGTVKIDGKDVTPVVVVGQNAVVAKMNDKQKAAVAAVFGVSDPAKALVSMFEKTVKLSPKNPKVIAVLDIKLPDGVTMPKDGIDLPINVDGVKKGDANYFLLHLKEDGTWESVKTTATADGVLTGHFTSLSPVYVVKTESTSALPAKTGDASLFWIVGVLAAGGALVAFSRKRIAK